jgi:radical SAM protein with 4Fe4S-binding SPASM domain
METDTKKLLEFKEFKEAYQKTNLSNCKYLKIKSPLAVQFELTSGCNQRCIFCYNVWKGLCSKQKTITLSKEKQLAVIDKIIENEIFDIIFSGGEPLLINWLEDLIKKCKKAKMYITIITNGQLMTLERARSLKEAGLDDMQISIHHYDLDKSDKIINMKGASEKSINGIKNAIQVFRTDTLNVNMVALPETHKDVYSMAKFLNSIGVKCFSVGTPSASGEMEKDKKLVIDKKMFLEVYNQLVKAREDFGMKVGFSGGFPLCLLPELNKDSIAMIGNYCDVGLNQLTIGPGGELRPCVCLGEKLGNILEDDLKEIWENNQFLIDARMMKFVPESCKNCNLVSSCRGGCRASALGYFGKINALDPLKENEK